MGWLFMRDMGGYATPRSYLDNQFTYQRDTHRLTVLASAMVGSTYYAACERLADDAERIVFGIVCLTKTSTGARDGCTFGYKDMDETVGPNESECPAAILDELTETDSEYALAWLGAHDAALTCSRGSSTGPSRPRSPGRRSSSMSPCASATVATAAASRWSPIPRARHRCSATRKAARSAASRHFANGHTASFMRRSS